MISLITFPTYCSYERNILNFSFFSRLLLVQKLKWMFYVHRGAAKFTQNPSALAELL